LASTVRTPLDDHNVRRRFRVITEAAGLGKTWVPRELRHAFVSLLSAHGVPVEAITLLAGHNQTATPNWFTGIRSCPRFLAVPKLWIRSSTDQNHLAAGPQVIAVEAVESLGELVSMLCAPTWPTKACSSAS
jgi:integrase-like protein